MPYDLFLQDRGESQAVFQDSYMEPVYFLANRSKGTSIKSTVADSNSSSNTALS